MAALNTQKAAQAGALVTYGPADVAGDTFKGTSRGMFLVKNADTVAHVVTIVVPGNTRYGMPEPDITLSVGAGADAAFGPFDRGLTDAAGDVQVSYDAVTGVDVAYVEL